MDKLLWGLQAILAIKFVSVAMQHGLGSSGPKWQLALERMGGLARPLLLTSAFGCLLGALGLILPGLLRWPRSITPLAAAGLALWMAVGVGLHRQCRDGANVIPGLVLLAMALFVAVGRWWLEPL